MPLNEILSPYFSQVLLPLEPELRKLPEIIKRIKQDEDIYLMCPIIQDYLTQPGRR